MPAARLNSLTVRVDLMGGGGFPPAQHGADVRLDFKAQSGYNDGITQGIVKEALDGTAKLAERLVAATGKARAEVADASARKS